uniref:Insulin-like domain-containing protein n=1 Tax=Meloidogyne floridensis TaxID=298350 RepID=A0A915NIK4_9BILA
MNQQNIYYIKTYRRNLHNIRRNSREILFCPLAAFLFTLTSLLIINIINKNILKVDAAKRRLCGPRLTSELWRVCTKAGSKDPCIHGVSKRITTNQRNIFIKERQLLRRNYLSLSNQLLTNNGELFKNREIENKILERRKRKGIVDECCKGEGCDESFLDSFCCNEDEQKTLEKLTN